MIFTGIDSVYGRVREDEETSFRPPSITVMVVGNMETQAVLLSFSLCFCYFLAFVNCYSYFCLLSNFSHFWLQEF